MYVCVCVCVCRLALQTGDLSMTRSWFEDREGQDKTGMPTSRQAYNKYARARVCVCVCVCHCRSVELIMGSRAYGPAVDMWSVGCIFFELLVSDL